jgi:sterol desaturase/sphingolipid hydroxylase (fatty acid hydroxylase superfamily)
MASRIGVLGWITGVLSAVLGALAFGAVLCLWFPAVLTTPALRDVYPMDLVRATIKVTLGVAFVLGVASVLLKRRKGLGLTGAGLALLATLMGGSEVAVATPVARSNHVGLDWFLLDLFLLSAMFVPIELLFGRLREQPFFRAEWRTDLWHFGVSHLLVQLTVFLTMAPAALFFRWAVAPELQAAVAAQPLVVQFVEVLVVADLTQYGVHRLFHVVPWLWRFHEIHHSSRHMDWLAGSRLHLVDIVVTRGLTFVPLYVAGFAPGPVFAYVLFVSFQAVLIHANVSWRFGPLRWVLATPQYHHWHHAVEPVDVNFAVHLPVIDAIFGTFHLPADRWPAVYGVAGNPVPRGYWAQLTYPFRSFRPSARSSTSLPTPP